MLGAAITGVTLLLFCGSMAVQGYRSKTAPALGLAGDKLRPCPPTPNCVSSDAAPGDHHTQAFALKAPNDPPLQAIARIIGAMPRARVVVVEDHYLHAEFTSLVFRFVDDVEFHYRPAQSEVAVRSASRVGHGDLGVNRRRVERLRKALADAGLTP
jgi:uncharacterized protein (DUF1499 family)